MATENGHDSLKKNTDFDDDDRFAVPTNWTKNCMDAYGDQGVCVGMRWGSGSPEGFMDTAINTYKNWY